MPSFWTKKLNIGSDNKKANPQKRIFDTTRDAEGKDIHWKLSLTVRHQAKPYENYSFRIPTIEDGVVTREINEPCEVPNYVTANLGFIVSDGPARPDKLHGRKFITFPVTIRDYDLCTWKGDSHTLHRFDVSDFAQILNRRNKTNFDPKTVNSYALTYYYHGEQALANYMETPEFFKWGISKLEKAGITAGHKIYNVILDIHSVREVCANCQQMLEYLISESYSNGFLYGLKQALNAANYITSRKHPLYMAIRVSADMLNGSSNHPIKTITEHDENTIVSANSIGTARVNGAPWILQRHDHRVFFDEKTLNQEVSYAALRQTIFCSGSWISTRIPLRGYTSLSRLWPEYPYRVNYLTSAISSASSLVPSANFKEVTRDIPLLVAEYLVGDQTVKDLKTEVSKVESLKPAYNWREQETDIPLLVAEYANEEPVTPRLAR